MLEPHNSTCFSERENINYDLIKQYRPLTNRILIDYMASEMRLRYFLEEN